MSQSLSVRTLGPPYFAAVTQSTLSAASLPFGVAQVVLEFRVLAAPTQSASASENHKLFCFADWGPAPAIYFALGITPSGALALTTPGGTNLLTAPGRIASDGAWHTATVTYDGGAGDFTSILDGDPQVVGNDGAGGFPNSGRSQQIILFNGNDALTNMQAAIRDCTIFANGSTWGLLIEYPFTENGSQTLTPTLTATVGAPPLLTNGESAYLPLQLQWLAPLGYAPVWGAVPSGDVAPAYTWDLNVDYRRREPPAVSYRRRA